MPDSKRWSRNFSALLHESWFRIVSVCVLMSALLLYLVLTDFRILLPSLQHNQAQIARAVEADSREAVAISAAMEDGADADHALIEHNRADAVDSASEHFLRRRSPRDVAQQQHEEANLHHEQAAMDLAAAASDQEHEALLVREVEAASEAHDASAKAAAAQSPVAPVADVSAHHIALTSDAVMPTPSPFPHIEHLLALADLMADTNGRLDERDEEILDGAALVSKAAGVINAEDAELFGTLRALRLHVAYSADAQLPLEEEDTSIRDEADHTPGQSGWCHDDMKHECVLQQPSALLSCILMQNTDRHPLCAALSCDGRSERGASQSLTCSARRSAVSNSSLAASLSSSLAASPSAAPLPSARCSASAPCLHLRLEWVSIPGELLAIHHKALTHFLHPSIEKRRSIYADSLVIVYPKSAQPVRFTAAHEGTAQSAAAAPPSRSLQSEPWYRTLLSGRGVRPVHLPKSRLISRRLVASTAAAAAGVGSASAEDAVGLRLGSLEVSTAQARKQGMDGLLFIKHCTQLREQLAQMTA